MIPFPPLVDLIVEELPPKESYEAMVKHFGWIDEDTAPMELVPTSDDEFRDRLKRAGLWVDIDLDLNSRRGVR